MLRTARIIREWARWFDARGVPAADIAKVLEATPETIWRCLAYRQDKPDDAVWPFHDIAPADVRKRRILAWTATYCRRFFALDYRTDRVAELLELDPAAVDSFHRRLRRLRGTRSDRLEAGDMIRPRTLKEERAAKSAYHRAWKRRRKRELSAVPPEWSYGARSAASRSEAAALVALQTAVREGRLTNGELLDLASLAYAVPARAAPPELPEPAIWADGPSQRIDRGELARVDWTNPEQQAGAKLNWKKVDAMRKLRARGWGTRDLADRYDIHVSMVRAILRGDYWRRPPAEPPVRLLLPADPRAWTGATSIYDPTADPHAKLTQAMVDEARDLRARGWLVKDLAVRFGVGGTTMSEALTGRTWRGR